MKSHLLKLAIAGLALTTLPAYTSLKNSPPEYAVDLVCNMKVQISEAYKYKYEGKKYYFDSYTCKQSFKMNPKKFINNQCAPQSTPQNK